MPASNSLVSKKNVDHHSYSSHRLASRLSLRLSFTLALIATVLGLTACGKKDEPGAGAPAAPPPAQVSVVEVQPQRVPITIEAVGTVQGSKQVEVRARVSGLLLKQIYKEGDFVKAGAPLFQIDPTQYQIALAQAKAQLGEQQARLEQAKREEARLAPLAKERAISQKEYDDAVSTAQLQNASIMASKAAVEDAERNLSYTNVTAPVSGVTGIIAQSEGSLIAAGSTNSLLTTINQIDPIWVGFSISESDLAKLPDGRLPRNSNVVVRIVKQDGSLWPVKGRLNFAASTIDTRLGTQQLRGEFDNRNQDLLPGQYVRVQLIAGQRDNVFLVPQPAVIQTEKGFFVFVIDQNNKAQIKPVKTGDWVGSNWAILSGLNPGDRVIVDNLIKVRPDAQVNPQLVQTNQDNQANSSNQASASGSSATNTMQGTTQGTTQSSEPSRASDAGVSRNGAAQSPSTQHQSSDASTGAPSK